MTRLRTPRIGIALALILVAALVIQTACNGPKVAKTADVAATVLLDIKPIVQQLVQGGVLAQDQADKVLNKLDSGSHDLTLFASAIRDKNAATALEKAEAAIDVVESLVADAQLIPAGVNRTRIIVLLGVVQMSLHIIAEYLANELPPEATIGARSTGAGQKIIAYARSPAKCARSSVTGRFITIEEARKHPDTTTIGRCK